jgi:hypothetical protein
VQKPPIGRFLLSLSTRRGHLGTLRVHEPLIGEFHFSISALLATAVI